MFIEVIIYARRAPPHRSRFLAEAANFVEDDDLIAVVIDAAAVAVPWSEIVLDPVDAAQRDPSCRSPRHRP
jgi:hypothetical protein